LQKQAVVNRIAVEAAEAAEASKIEALLETKLLKMENDALKAQITSLRSEVTVTLGAHDFAVSKINVIQAERDLARSQLSIVTNNYDILQEDNEALEAKFESLQAELMAYKAMLNDVLSAHN
jgi:chromosome segregation ATPase